MTLLAAPNPAAAPPRVSARVAGDGWWPDLDLAAFRDAMRVGATVTDGRARDALVAAMITVADALVAWRAGHVAAGVEALALIPAPDGTDPVTFGGEPRVVALWRRAVFATAAADLAETHNDVGASDLARDRRELRIDAGDELRRTATVAIRDLLGRRRTKVALV